MAEGLDFTSRYTTNEKKDPGSFDKDTLHGEGWCVVNAVTLCGAHSRQENP